MTPIILAIDTSLTSTGLCLLYADGQHKTGNITTEAKDWQPGMGRFERYGHIVESVVRFVPCNGIPQAIFIEGYSFGSKGAAVVNLGELGGLLRNRLMKVFGCPVHEIQPSMLKKWSTQSGSADKTAMALAAYKTFGFENKSNDVIDAFLLSQLGAQVCLGHEPRNKVQRAIIDAITNPTPKRTRKKSA